MGARYTGKIHVVGVNSDSRSFQKQKFSGRKSFLA